MKSKIQMLTAAVAMVAAGLIINCVVVGLHYRKLKALEARYAEDFTDETRTVYTVKFRQRIIPGGQFHKDMHIQDVARERYIALVRDPDVEIDKVLCEEQKRKIGAWSNTKVSTWWEQ